MTELRPTHIVHRGAGCPALLDAARVPLRTHDARPCGRCGDPAGVYRYGDVVSDTTLPVSLARELLAGGDALCAACAFCIKDLRLRCAPWIAREDGVWFVPTRGLLRVLLDPPEPPFVVAAPLYGAAHGGEAQGWRATWSHEPALPEGHAVLQRLQAKACAAFAETAVSRERFALQVDNAVRIAVDVPRWRVVVDAMDALTTAMRAARCGYTEQRAALTECALPPCARWHDARTHAAMTRAWRALTAPMRPHLTADWYRLIARDLYEITTGATP